MAAARNAGFAAASGEFVIFLDADDRLLPDAAAVGLHELARHPDAVFAAGLCQVVDEDGRPAPFTQRRPLSAPPYVELLRGNFIWMPGQVVFRRAALTGGPFDRRVNACADYDLYLRLTRRFPVVVHERLVADYRQHPSNMSGNAGLMLKTSLRVLGRQRALLQTGRECEAYREGQHFWRRFYGEHLVEEIRAALHTPGRRARAARKIGTMLRYHPAGALRQLLRKARVMLRGGRTAAPVERVPW